MSRWREDQSAAPRSAGAILYLLRVSITGAGRRQRVEYASSRKLIVRIVQMLSPVSRQDSVKCPKNRWLGRGTGFWRSPACGSEHVHVHVHVDGTWTGRGRGRKAQEHKCLTRPRLFA